MKRLLPILFALGVSPCLAQSASPVSSLDGDWHGRSDGGSCNAPLDYQLTIDTGIVDGTSYDTSARGPVPNTKKSAPPPPTPGLWQIHGIARGSSFSLLATASVSGTAHRETRLSVVSQGGSLVVAEEGGCGRKATLSR
jgi:hypothetical protein